MAKLVLNITDQHSELLDKVEVEVTKDFQSPLSGGMVAIVVALHEAAHIIQSRVAKGEYANV